VPSALPFTLHVPIPSIACDAYGSSHRLREVLLLQQRRTEPAHIHIEQAGALAKFWLDPVALAASSRFSGHELRRLEKQVLDNREQFLEAWRDYFGA